MISNLTFHGLVTQLRRQKESLLCLNSNQSSNGKINEKFSRIAQDFWMSRDLTFSTTLTQGWIFYSGIMSRQKASALTCSQNASTLDPGA